MELEQTIIIFLYKGKKESCQGEKIKTKKRKPIRDYMLKRERERERESSIAELRAPKQRDREKHPHCKREWKNTKRHMEIKETQTIPRIWNIRERDLLTLGGPIWQDLLPSCSSSTPSLSLSLSLSVCLFLCVREKRTKTEKMFLYDFPFV